MGLILYMVLTFFWYGAVSYAVLKIWRAIDGYLKKRQQGSGTVMVYARMPQTNKQRRILSHALGPPLAEEVVPRGSLPGWHLDRF